jgi:hypothetical protein
MLYEKAKWRLRNIPWLRKINFFGNIVTANFSKMFIYYIIQKKKRANMYICEIILYKYKYKE